MYNISSVYLFPTIYPLYSTIWSPVGSQPQDVHIYPSRSLGRRWTKPVGHVQRNLKGTKQRKHVPLVLATVSVIMNWNHIFWRPPQGPKKICEIQNINTHGHRTNKLWGYFINQEWPWVRLCARDISTLHVSSRCVSINQKVDMERLLVVLVSYLRALSCKLVYLDFHGFISPFIHLVV